MTKNLTVGADYKMSKKNLSELVMLSAKSIFEGEQNPVEPEKLISLVKQALQLSDWLSQEINKRNIPDIEKIVCKHGCAWCCYMQVGVSAPEVFAIADYLANNKSTLSLDDAKIRLTSLDHKTNNLSAISRLATQQPCAFLVNNSCSIYEVRPLACRGSNSIDSERCRLHVEDIDDLLNEKKYTSTPWIHDIPFSIMSTLREGMTAGIEEWGIYHVKLELTAAVRIAVEDPNAIEDWMAGKDVFRKGKLNSV
jgi:Fe-S-cluster containining protein